MIAKDEAKQKVAGLVAEYQSTELYTQLHIYNRRLSSEQIDEVIQRIFNRLIFIRTCEDRGIEERTLLAAVNQWKSSGHKPELVEGIPVPRQLLLFPYAVKD